MGICPSRKQAPKNKKAETWKPEKPQPKSALRADAEEFVPRKQYVPVHEWEQFLEQKQEMIGKSSPFTRRQDGTFTAEYRQLLQTKDRPVERAAGKPATGQVSEDVVRSWKEAGQAMRVHSGAQARARPSGTGKLSPKAHAHGVLAEALRKVKAMPKKEAPKVCSDDSVADGRQHRAVPFGLTDRHYFSDSGDANKSHVHRSLTPTSQREYVPRPPSCELEESLTEVLYKLRLLKDQEASVGPSRRYCVGLREVMRASKEKGALRAVVVAPDLEQNGRGSLDEKVQQLLATCRASKTPVVFGLSRLRLGQAIQKSVTISVLGILDTRGVQEPFERMLALA